MNQYVFVLQLLDTADNLFSSMTSKQINIHRIGTGSAILKNHVLHRITDNFPRILN